MPAGKRKIDWIHMNATRPGKTTAIRFLSGDEDYPVLMPLTGPGGSTARSIAFCRAVHPTASLLLPDLRRLHRASREAGRPNEEMLLEGLSEFLSAAVSALRLALFPIVAVGQGAGADLAAKFALRTNPNLAAVLLFKPTADVSSVTVGSLKGLSVLMVMTAPADVTGSAEWKIRTAFSAGGANVICEFVPQHSRRGEHDAALARVFIASQFGLSD